ncbi:hypothetical protein [Actibacterium ureilyticum]|uniref:hypothetical protein n=1 Tax=Actibacterium ureilyticum TaxID=1590614 RepID=UPI000BAAF065|nr:hypothetical protein [Actibacterium ureilyticum]
MSRALDQAILDAHRDRDRRALVTLYTEAAQAAPDADARAYFLTFAYVYALETGTPQAGALHARLRGLGRET